MIYNLKEFDDFTKEFVTIQWITAFLFVCCFLNHGVLKPNLDDYLIKSNKKLM